MDLVKPNNPIVVSCCRCLLCLQAIIRISNWDNSKLLAPFDMTNRMETFH